MDTCGRDYYSPSGGIEGGFNAPHVANIEAQCRICSSVFSYEGKTGLNKGSISVYTESNGESNYQSTHETSKSDASP